MITKQKFFVWISSNFKWIITNNIFFFDVDPHKVVPNFILIHECLPKDSFISVLNLRFEMSFCLISQVVFSEFSSIILFDFFSFPNSNLTNSIHDDIVFLITIFKIIKFNLNGVSMTLLHITALDISESLVLTPCSSFLW